MAIALRLVLAIKKGDDEFDHECIQLSTTLTTEWPGKALEIVKRGSQMVPFGIPPNSSATGPLDC